MPLIPRPSPCYLDNLRRERVRNGRQTWISNKGDRFYQWDELHGEIEVYNSRGRHLGALDAVTGVLVKEAVRGRRIDVS